MYLYVEINTNVMLELSLYKPGKDSVKIFDKTTADVHCWCDVFVHKYLDPQNPRESKQLLASWMECCKRLIFDMLFLENGGK